MGVWLHEVPRISPLRIPALRRIGVAREAAMRGTPAPPQTTTRSNTTTSEREISQMTTLVYGNASDGFRASIARAIRSQIRTNPPPDFSHGRARRAAFLKNLAEWVEFSLPMDSP